MLLELSNNELEEIQALQEIFDMGIISVDEENVSFTVDLVDKEEEDKTEDTEESGVYAYILHMYHNRIDVNSIDKEKIEHIRNVLMATKEFLQSIGGIRINCDIADKLQGYFEKNS